MGPHRFLDHLNVHTTTATVMEGPRAGAFMACPVVLCSTFGGMQAAWQQQLYQAAYEQARAEAHRPAPFQRDWLGTWN